MDLPFHPHKPSTFVSGNNFGTKVCLSQSIWVLFAVFTVILYILISVVAESKVDSKQLDSVVSPNLFCRTLLFHWTCRSVYCLRCYWWGVHYACHFGVCFLYALYQLCSQFCVSFPGDLLLALWDRPHCIGQGSLKLMVLLPQSPEHWNYRHESASLVCMKTSSMVTFNFFFILYCASCLSRHCISANNILIYIFQINTNSFQCYMCFSPV